MKTTLICLLDKEYPPEHSFVDGMLAHELPLSGNVKVMLVVSRGKSKRKVLKYGKSICFPLLWARKGLTRFANIFLLLPFLIRMIRRQKKRGARVSLFIRNEPVFLFAGWVLQRLVNRIVFQQSFPHEQGSSVSIKKVVAVWIFKITAKSVDAIVSVSPLGLERLKQYFPHHIRGLIIPLLGYKLERLQEDYNPPSPEPREKVRFVYTGTLNEARKLEVVFRAIVKAWQNGVFATFDFIGGEPQDVKRLRKVQGVSNLEKSEIIRFVDKMPREKLLSKLPLYHVGLCLIPPTPLFREASPTKLVEYMYKGLAVLASKGIPLQEEYILESGGGLLVEWAEDDIAKAIIQLSSNIDEIKRLRVNALSYANDNLDYKLYVSNLKMLL